MKIIIAFCAGLMVYAYLPVKTKHICFEYDLHINQNISEDTRKSIVDSLNEAASKIVEACELAKGVKMKKPVIWNENTFYNRIGIREHEAKSIVDPKKMNGEEIKPEEELDFEDYDDCEEEYEDSEYEE